MGKKICKILTLLITLSVFAGTISTEVFASEEKLNVEGTVYKFNEKDDYEFSTSKEGQSSAKANTYGTLSVEGNISDVQSNTKVPEYVIKDGEFSITYSYDDKMLKAGLDEWHLEDDKSKNIDSIDLEDKMLKGSIIIQTSKDQKNWMNVYSKTNQLADKKTNSKSLYKATETQLLNGCYYRVIVAYKTAKRTKDSNFLFINTDEYSYKKYAEVYEFYASYETARNTNIDLKQTYSLGKAVRCEQFKGYFGEEDMENSDPHYNTKIGQFYVSGYTDNTVDSNGNPVFLKNVGDKVTLWFDLIENIDAIKNNKDITVTADSSGYDQYFQTETTDFGRGTLIIRSIDQNNNYSKPEIYQNYLEASTSTDADTQVKLFEEGDYEVALDYELTEDKFPLDSEAHYRIYFKFSIRNSNCMVYPFDLETGSELTNSSTTNSGFRLDYANSNYLKVNVKKEVLTDGADGLVEDTRFNVAAKDGAQYTEEGIYTITVENLYTKVKTEKKIYVGENKLLKAYLTTGYSIPEINKMVASGAVLNEDGTISNVSNEQSEDTEVEEPTTESNWNRSYLILIPIILIVIVSICIITKKRKRKLTDDENKKEGE